MKKQEEIQRAIAAKKKYELKCAQERDAKRKEIAEVLINEAKQFLEENNKEKAREALLMIDEGNRDQKWKDLFKKSSGTLIEGEE